jgi:futalosine hydrolase
MRPAVSRLLVVTAVPPERDAVLARLVGDVDVFAVGVGSAAAAAGTARLLALGDYHAVIAAGIAGVFGARVPIGGLVLGTESVAADLGADSPDGFVALSDLGFGPTRLPSDDGLLRRLGSALPAAVAGPVLTVSTVTGTAAGTAELVRRHPDAVAEAMEGFGVATAAAGAGRPFVELRAISNLVGPRDRESWRIPAALAALTEAGAVLGSLAK